MPWDYFAVGGTCPRTTLRYFEDYDFWLRMLAFGRTGVIGGDVGGFWYRRHEKGMSSKIMKESYLSRAAAGWWEWVFGGGGEEVKVEQVTDREWLREGRVNNPVTFGDLTRGDAERFLRMRNERRVGGKVEMENDLEGFMPCYRTFEVVDSRLSPEVVKRWDLRREARSGALAGNVRWHEYHGWIAEGSHVNGSLVNPMAPLPPLFPAHVFPFNPTSFARTIAKSKIATEGTTRLPPAMLYMLPWMVTGGADLYDLHVLASAASIHASTTLIVARNLETHPHPWSHLFMSHVKEVFHLQNLSNDTKVQKRIVNYLAESRGCEVAVNSRTVVGYEAFENWGLAAKTNESEEISTHPTTLIDIIHLHHPPPDNSNWEHRSARISHLLTHRVVVSQELKNHSIHVLGHGDTVLGKPSMNTSSIYNPELCYEDGGGVWHGGRCAPLDATESDKIEVIYPPLDLFSNTKGSPEQDKFAKNLMELVMLDESLPTLLSQQSNLLHRILTSSLPSMTNPSTTPSLYFIGRFELQKDPVMWTKVASKATHIYKSLSKPPSHTHPNIHMVGSGSLLPKIYTQVTKDTNLDTPPAHPSQPSTTHFHPSIPHARIPQFLMTMSQNSVLLMTSRVEGLPIVVLEGLAVGVPVVTMECGGTVEAMERVKGEKREDVSRSGIRVTRMELGAVVHVDCAALLRDGEGGDEDGEADGVFQGDVEDVMAAEVVRIWREIDGAAGDKERMEVWLRRWNAGRGVREEFGVDKFKENWLRLLKGSG
ncbi:hypothetical protein HDU98_008109 [Podochytrium sp. JEL0797]|nr:hypothetical protein HDU98_008109 [Podochytrium sp. JEL0797]